MERTKKIVHFNDSKNIVHVMHVWLYACKAARKSKWEEMARDRERFRIRISRFSSIIEPILLCKLQSIQKINLKKS